MATKPKGKAKSAVSGRYVSKATAAADPERTYVSKANPTHLILSRADLAWLSGLFHQAAFDLEGWESSKKTARISLALTAAIRAHKDASRKAKK